MLGKFSWLMKQNTLKIAKKRLVGKGEVTRRRKVR